MSPNPITIRSLGPDDVDVLSRVRAGEFDFAFDPARAWAFLAVGVNHIAVALDRGEVVGFACGTVLFHPVKPTAMLIAEVEVHAGFRRQGIGRRLTESLIETARGRGCERVWLKTDGGNAAARALYRAMAGRETEGVAVFEWRD